MTSDTELARVRAERTLKEVVDNPALTGLDNILSKLGLASRTQAAVYALRGEANNRDRGDLTRC